MCVAGLVNQLSMEVAALRHQLILMSANTGQPVHPALAPAGRPAPAPGVPQQGPMPMGAAPKVRSSFGLVLRLLFLVTA